MMRDQSFRSFKGGSWDLRKQDRRQNQQVISFPDRRQNDRRANALDESLADAEVTWVGNPGLDE